MEKELKQLEEFIPFFNREHQASSQANIGWHLWHSIQVIHSICDALLKSDPKEFKPSFSIYRSFFLAIGWFPRGKAKAPKIVRYTDHISIDQLTEDLRVARKKLADLEGLPPNAFFLHPYFKATKLKTAKRFIVVHTRHHLKIVEDIFRKSGS